VNSKKRIRTAPPAEIFAGPNVFEMHEVIQHAESKGSRQEAIVWDSPQRL
jgi:hypothetical protein